MDKFYEGFEKKAIVGAAFGAGIGMGGAYSKAKKEMEVSRIKEDSIEDSSGLNPFLKKLLPGDIIYSGSAAMPGDEDFAKKLGYSALPIIGGNVKYHSMVYTGKGKVIDAARHTQKGKKSDVIEIPLRDKIKGQRKNEYALTAYRAVGSDPEERSRAVERARSLVGASYPDNKEMAIKALKTLAGLPGKKDNIDKGDKIVCQDVAIKAYSRRFPKRHMTVAEMQYSPNFTPVAKVGKYDYNTKDKLLSENSYPILKAVRAGAQGAVAGGAVDVLRKAIKNRRS